MASSSSKKTERLESAAFKRFDGWAMRLDNLDGSGRSYLSYKAGNTVHLGEHDCGREKESKYTSTYQIVRYGR